jgi:hypothetical protein
VTSDPSHPATRHPEASYANCKVVRHGFREAEGSALLHRRAIKTAWMIGCPEEQRSRSFASKAWCKEQSIVCSAQDGAFMRIEIDDSGYSNLRNALSAVICGSHLRYSRNSNPAALIPSTTLSRVRVTSSAVNVRSSAPSVSLKETLFLSGGSGKISRNCKLTSLSPAN